MRIISAFLSLAFILSCSKKNEEISQAQEVKPAQQISQSFSLGAKDIKGRPVVSIKKSALEKEFLLQVGWIEQTFPPLGESFKSKVVIFRKRGDLVFLVEANYGHQISTELPQNIILASYPVLEETAEDVAFDFNQGMSKLFLASDNYAQDFDGHKYYYERTMVNLKESYLEEVIFNQKNALVVRQMASTSVSGFLGMGQFYVPMEVKYYLSPYLENPGFEKVISKDFKQAGFFEVAPLLRKDGGTTIHAMKFDHRKPIRFAISSNTPPEYYEAVKEGVEYWNKAFGKKIVEAYKGPQGVTAPNFDYNIVQWVTYDQSGAAYADMQADPRTGEVLHAQVYVPSSFAVNSRRQARRMMNRLVQTEALTAQKPAVGLRGFSKSRLCKKENSLMNLGILSTFLADEKWSDEAFARAGQDMVRSTVAHEIGHVLGLRHNFAGSLTTKNYSLAHRRANLIKYLILGKLGDNVVPASSLMDYLPFQEDIFVGGLIREGKPALEHDHKAIEMLYLNKKFDRTEIPLFCTDSHVATYNDCKRWDAGASLIEFASASVMENFDSLPYQLIERFALAKAPDAGRHEEPVESIGFNPEKIAETIFLDRQNIIKSLASPKTYFLSIFRQFPSVSPVNHEKVKEREFAYISQEIERLGKMEKVFGLVNKNYYTKMPILVEKLLREFGMKEGVAGADQAYQFNESEIQTIVAKVQELAVELPKAVTKEDLKILSGIGDALKTLKTAFGRDLANLLETRMREYLLQVAKEIVQVEVEVPDITEAEATQAKDAKVARKKVTVNLPLFFYDFEARSAAAKLLKPSDKPEGIAWGFQQRTKVRAEFKQLLNKACDCNFEKVKTAEIKVLDEDKKDQVTRWFLENKTVLDNVGSDSSPAVVPPKTVMFQEVEEDWDNHTVKRN